MKKLFLILLIFFVSEIIHSCKKNNAVATNDNEIMANIVVASGGSFNLNAKGSDASFIKGRTLELTQLNGGDGNQLITISFNNVSDTGTYPYDCIYQVNHYSTQTPIYENSGFWVTQPGSVTINILNGNHIEGSFTAVGKMGLGATDSAIINGTFKGDLKVQSEMYVVQQKLLNNFNPAA